MPVPVPAAFVVALVVPAFVVALVVPAFVVALVVPAFVVALVVPAFVVALVVPAFVVALVVSFLAGVVSLGAAAAPPFKVYLLLDRFAFLVLGHNIGALLD